MSRRKRRRQGVGAGCMAVPLIALLAGWARLGEPLHQAGFALLALTGIVFGLFAPGIVVSCRALHLLLIPDRVLIWWRDGRPRPAIPAYLRRAVLSADSFRCCWCDNTLDLQVDHIKPWSRGGLNAMWNLMTLCGHCNRVKSNCWVARDGFVFYRPWKGLDNENVALQMLRYELWHRWHPARWVRAALSLTS